MINNSGFRCWRTHEDEKVAIIAGREIWKLCTGQEWMGWGDYMDYSPRDLRRFLREYGSA